MTKRPQAADDPTSIGAILIAMSAITPEQLVEAVEQQERSTLEHLLGKLLVADGHCTSEQLDIALAAQEAMRSKDKKRQALAVAEIATVRKRGTNGARQRLIERSASIVRKATGQGHPAVAPEMLAKSNNESSG
jgi:hypothetical protein